MWDYAINQVHVQDVSGLDTNLQPLITKRVQYMIGKQGPFVLTYKASEYSADVVQRDMQREVETLKTLHAATAAQQ